MIIRIFRKDKKVTFCDGLPLFFNKLVSSARFLFLLCSSWFLSFASSILSTCPIPPTSPICPTSPIRPASPIRPTSPICPICSTRPISPICPTFPTRPTLATRPISPTRPFFSTFWVYSSGWFIRSTMVEQERISWFPSAPVPFSSSSLLLGSSLFSNEMFLAL